jgi:dTDP-glucose 4,6-dehydratase
MPSVLVTGGAGFIGENFVHFWLARHPEDAVVVLDGFEPAKSFYAGVRETVAWYLEHQDWWRRVIGRSVVSF